jgi:hypothetical protein
MSGSLNINDDDDDDNSSLKCMAKGTTKKLKDFKEIILFLVHVYPPQITYEVICFRGNDSNRTR